MTATKCSAILLIVLTAFTSLDAQETQTTTASDSFNPASDPTNSGGWVLNEMVSDEFSGNQLDRSKWFVQGENGEYYIWKGRAPSQFAAHNVRVEDGMLKLRSQWEPDFDFAKEDYAGGTYGDKVAPVTTAGVITRKRFLYGYMETRSKAGNAAMTSSFWTIGHQSELDIYEQMGNPKMGTHTGPQDFLFTVHDWRPGRFEAQVGNNKTFTHKHKLDFRVADDFHVYGCDWSDDHLKFYLNGKLVHETTKEAVGDGWVLTNPMEIWFDSEIFRWMGYPDPDELPVDFEVDYVRVWQTPDPNVLDRAFFGFEGPILFQDNPKPLKLTPETDTENDYQKFWKIDEASSAHLALVGDRFASGIKSLQFDPSNEMKTDEVVIAGPEGSVRLPAGNFELSMKVWADPKSTLKNIVVSVANQDLSFDISNIDKGTWITLTQDLPPNSSPDSTGNMKIKISKKDALGGDGVVYIDDIAIKAIQ